MTETTLKKIIKVLFTMIIVFIFSASVILQVENPEWFIITTSKVNKTEAYIKNTEANNLFQGITEAELKQTEAPYLYCTGYKKDNCSYLNVPTGEPYVMQTKWFWLYKYQYIIALILLFIALLLYKETLTKWKNTLSN